MVPLIGITAGIDAARWGPWDRAAVVLAYEYLEAVQDAGGRAVLVPPAVEGVDRVCAALDGLVLTGGADLDPALYGAPREPETVGIQPARDAGERALLAAATAAGLPVLGICRGMQLMVAASGGRLHQHLPDAVGSDRHRPAIGVYGEHAVRTVPGTCLAELIGPTATVPTYHHQGIADAGTLTVSAYADDGTIEGVERPGETFWVGVLWHPEMSDDRRLFRGLCAASLR